MSDLSLKSWLSCLASLITLVTVLCFFQESKAFEAKDINILESVIVPRAVLVTLENTVPITVELPTGNASFGYHDLCYITPSGNAGKKNTITVVGINYHTREVQVVYDAVESRTGVDCPPQDATFNLSFEQYFFLRQHAKGLVETSEPN